jgi:hypothetical protein
VSTAASRDRPRRRVEMSVMVTVPPAAAGRAAPAGGPERSFSTPSDSGSHARTAPATASCPTSNASTAWGRAAGGPTSP